MNQSSTSRAYSLYDSSHPMAGKCRALARLRSSAQKQRTKRFVFRVTGSVKSPPGGETAPMIVMLP